MKYKMDPTFEAVKRNDLPSLQAALTAGRSPDLFDVQCGTLLSFAVQQSATAIVRLLIQAGANVNAGRYHWQLPLIRAISTGDAPIFKILLESGATPGPFLAGKFKGYVSAFYLAIYSGRDEIVGMLLQHGFKVDDFLETSLTPLMLAAKEGHAKLVRQFLGEGATVDKCDPLGRTAVSWAVIANLEAEGSDLIADDRHVEVLTELLLAGARPNPLDSGAKALLAWAQERACPQITALLEEFTPKG